MKQLIKFCSNWLIGILIIVCLCTFLAFLGRWNPFFDLASHFRLVYFWVQLGGLIALVGWKRFKLAVIVLLCLLTNAGQIFTYYWPPQAEIQQSVSTHIRLLQLNTWASNRHPERIAALLSKVEPGVVALEELSAKNYAILQSKNIRKKFPYEVYYPQDRLLLLSRYLMIGQPEFFSYPPMIKAQLKVGQQALSVIVVHTWRPIGNYFQYLQQMQHLQKAILAMPSPRVVAGDLNTGPWSYPFNQLLQETKLVNTQAGNGIVPTYPCMVPKTQIPSPFPFLPIDHVLVSSNMQVIKRWNGPHSGSDHLPVIVDLGI